MGHSTELGDSCVWSEPYFCALSTDLVRYKLITWSGTDPQQSDRFLEQFLVFFRKSLEELVNTYSKLVKLIFTAKICEKLSVFFVFLLPKGLTLTILFGKSKYYRTSQSSEVGKKGKYFRRLVTFMRLINKKNIFSKLSRDTPLYECTHLFSLSALSVIVVISVL